MSEIACSCFHNEVSRLVLGTAQFGMPYGIANRQGKICADEARAILEYAKGAGLNMLDTAVAYGESETLLGEIGVSQWQVVSKLPAVPDTCNDVRTWVFVSVESSLRRLQIPQLKGLLLHRPDQLLGDFGQVLYRALDGLKEQRLVEKIGISIYDPTELDGLCSRFNFDIVQAPFNLVDHRMVESGWMNRLSCQGTEVHVRSIFLQGLLLMPSYLRPERFNRWQPLWSRLQQWLSSVGLTPLRACLQHALTQPQIDRVIVGVDDISHLKEILRVADAKVPDVPPELHCGDLDLINPVCWSKPQ